MPSRSFKCGEAGQAIRFSCPKGIIDGFRKAAAKSFPWEEYAVLIGNREGDLVTVHDIWYPDGRKKLAGLFSTEHIFSVKEWMREAKRIARSKGMEVLADIHSHPDCSQCHPSEEDWDGMRSDWIQGICGVYRAKKRIRTRVRFWGPAKKIKEFYRE